MKEYDGVKDAPRDWVIAAGQSKRIWNELYKVIDSSDVVLQVCCVGPEISISIEILKHKHVGSIAAPNYYEISYLSAFSDSDKSYLFLELVF